MRLSLRNAWAGMIRTSFKNVRHAQVAVICMRETDGLKEVLLVTTRDDKSWIIPKGWPVEGLDDAASALHEAWEEAGVRSASIDEEPIGSFGYEKGLSDGRALPVEASVYLAHVTELATDYPQNGDRRRKWMTPQDAAELVKEPELKSILTAI